MENRIILREKEIVISSVRRSSEISLGEFPPLEDVCLNVNSWRQGDKSVFIRGRPVLETWWL